MRLRTTSFLGLLCATLALAAGCGSSGTGGGGETVTPPATPLSGPITADGSSRVGALVTLAAQDFESRNSGVEITIGTSSTPAGFERFCRGETDLSNAARPMTAAEAQACANAGVSYVELRVANDVLAVVVNPANDWADCLTVEELRRIWEPGSLIERWSDVRAGFPNQTLALFGPVAGSDAHDYFTEAIVGQVGASRTDYSAGSANVTVQGIAGTLGSLGYLPYAYYQANAAQLKASEIDSGAGCVPLTLATAQSGEYEPLSQPVYVYVNRASISKPQVKAFVRLLLDDAIQLATDVLFVPLTSSDLAAAKAQFEAAVGP